jgi:dolichyl-phosphate beta-glucosyltransferase
MESVYLSVVIPAYKEAKRIGSTLRSLEKYFADKDYSYEIIVVNDGSPDSTAAVVTNYMPKVKNLRLVDNAENCGKGYAVKCGMYEARGKYRLFMDADNSVKIKTVEAFLKEIKAGNDVVIGSISLPGSTVEEGSGWHRRFLGSLSKGLVRSLAAPGIYDTQRGFKLFTAQAAETIFPKQRIFGFGFDIELIVIANENNLRVKEVPVKWNNPAGSTVRLVHYATTLVELALIVLRKMKGSYQPLPVGASLVKR